MTTIKVLRTNNFKSKYSLSVTEPGIYNSIRRAIVLVIQKIEAKELAYLASATWAFIA